MANTQSIELNSSALCVLCIFVFSTIFVDLSLPLLFYCATRAHRHTTKSLGSMDVCDIRHIIDEFVCALEHEQYDFDANKLTNQIISPLNVGFTGSSNNRQRFCFFIITCSMFIIASRVHNAYFRVDLK